MNIYLHPSGVKKELKNAYIGEYMPTSWLLWYRPLEENLNDISGNGNNASWYSWTWTIWTLNWKICANVTRDSSWWATQQVITPVTRSSWPITVCSRINYTDVAVSNSWRCSFSNMPAWTWNYITQWLRTPDNNYPYIIINSNSFKLSSTVPTANVWYFVAITYEWTVVKYYLNWTLANTITVTSTSLWNWVFRFGGGNYDTSAQKYWWTQGGVRHCAIYNRALTADEVLEYYNNTK